VSPMNTELKTTVELTKAELEFLRQALGDVRIICRDQMKRVPKDMRKSDAYRRIKDRADHRINFSLTLDGKLGDASNLCK
jgi:hypothetical protein